MKCWWLRVFWSVVAFSVFLAGGAAAAPVPCSDIEDGKTQWKDCIPTKNLGNPVKFVMLDFSDGDQADINNFFAKGASDGQLFAGIRIVGNEKLQTLNLGQISAWNAASNMASDALLIEIVNNPILENIELNMTSIDPGRSYQVLVYNNPKLNLTNATVDLMMNKANPALSYIERELGDIVSSNSN